MKQVAQEIESRTSDWSRWYALPEGTNSAGEPIKKIKRYRRIGSRTQWQRYPSKEYQNLSASEIESLLRRLNATREIDRRAAEERYIFDHAYVNQHSGATDLSRNDYAAKARTAWQSNSR